MLGSLLADAFALASELVVPPSKQLFLESPSTRTSFGTDAKKQGCHESSARERGAVIPPRGKLYTDATMVLSSPFESLVLEAV